MRQTARIRGVVTPARPRFVAIAGAPRERFYIVTATFGGSADQNSVMTRTLLAWPRTVPLTHAALERTLRGDDAALAPLACRGIVADEVTPRVYAEYQRRRYQHLLTDARQVGTVIGMLD